MSRVFVFCCWCLVKVVEIAKSEVVAKTPVSSKRWPSNLACQMPTLHDDDYVEL